MTGCGGTCGSSCGSSCETSCGCCTGIGPSTPVPIANRYGLPALAYRVGTHGTFLATMRARLSAADRPALHALRTRESSDLTLALLDGWASVADVLTFYTERIANEGYLRTATERRSVLELARLIGYSPRPGLAASAFLAYTVEAGREVTVPVGSRVQSVPAPGELPQTFETSDPLLARGEWSALAPRRERAQLLTAETVPALRELVVAGAVADLRRGESLVVDVGGASTLFDVAGVEVDVPAGVTRLSVAARQADGSPAPPPARRGRAVARVTAGSTRLGALTEALRKPPSIPPPSERELRRDVPTLYGTDSGALSQLAGVLVPETRATLAAALANAVEPDPDPAVVERLRVRAGLFGHQAQPYPKYDDGVVIGFVDPLVTDLAVDTGIGPISLAAAGDVFQPPDYIAGTELFLDAVYDAVQAGDRLVLVNPDLAEPISFRDVVAAEPESVSALGLTVRVTHVTLDQAWPDADANLATVVRGTRVLGHGEVLVPAPRPMDDEDVAGDVVELAGLYADLEPGRWVVVAGERADAEIVSAQDGGAGTPATGVPGAELAMLAAVEHRSTRIAELPEELRPEGGADDTSGLPGDPVHTFLVLAEPLAFRYRRASVVVYANVVRATHGETKAEVLGSGDATRRFPAFPLKQPPLTYLPAPTAVGAAATLQLSIDDVPWQEAADLVEAGPDDRLFVLRTDDEGGTSVVLGDGVHGARAPTGRENVRAGYRSGIGRPGNVEAGRLTLLLSKPLGVTEVVNPLAATGGADRETRDQARRTAPLAVQALDRLVSVQDYEDFSRGFAGIGAASARELSDGRRLVVHVTIAGVDDAPIAATSDLFAALRRALLRLGDPFLDVEVAVRTLRVLVIDSAVKMRTGYAWAVVEPAVRAALEAAYGPAARSIAQPVTRADVLRTIQGVVGVDYAELRVLDSLDEQRLLAPDPAADLQSLPVVPAAAARLVELPDPPGGIGIAPGELLVLTAAVRDTLILAELP